VIEIMASPAFWPAYTVVPWVVGGYFLRFLYFFPVNHLFFRRETRWVPLATLAAGAANIGLNLALVPRFGYQAAAVNTFLGFGLLLAIVAAVGLRRYRVAYEYGRLARVLAIALALFALGWFLGPAELWPRLAWKLGLLAAFPLLLLASGFLSPPERRRVRQLWDRARRRPRPPAEPPPTPFEPPE
jgi:O-antigen/teichoic acid export membrane protein